MLLLSLRLTDSVVVAFGMFRSRYERVANVFGGTFGS